MTKPATIERGVVFDLAAIEREVRAEEAYLREGQSARTLVRERDQRIVLVAIKAGSQIAQHHAAETSSIHALSGQLRLRLPDKLIDLAAGQLLVLERDLAHDVQAVVDSAFLLTLGWKNA